MENDGDTLKSLEIVMTEFFSPETTNERKRDIEQSLNEFAARENWKSYIDFLHLTNNNYVLMFILTTLETIITTKHTSITYEDKFEIQCCLRNLSVKPDVVPFIRNKVIKLIIDTLKFSRNDTFNMNHIFSTIDTLLQGSQNYQQRLLGLKYLQIVSDELATPRKSEENENGRNRALLTDFSKFLPAVLCQLTELLAENLRVHSCSGTKTPPPSPTNDENLATSMSSLDIVGMENNCTEICISTLKVLSHIFSYIKSFQLVMRKTKLFDLIFTCAKYHDSMSGKQMEVAVEALSAINELLYRADLSLLSNDLLIHIFHNACELFQSISHLDNIDECYIDKVTEFLKLFVINYLKRSETIAKFSTRELLDILYHRTFHPTCTVNSYLRCLEIWIDLLEIVQLQHQILALNLHESILQKISFRLDPRIIKELDTEKLDENGETEWQHYLRCNIECLAKVSELVPIPVSALLYPTWRDGMTVFSEIASTISSQPSLMLNNEEASNCHSYLRDTASLTQALARILPTYLNNENHAISSVIEELVSVTLDACDFVKNNQLYSANVQPELIVHDIVEVYSQLLASLQAWCHWIWKRPDKIKETLCERCVNACMWALTASQSNSAPSKLIHSASHLFQSITVILKPNLWAHPLYKELLCSRSHPYFMENDTKLVVNKALINSITLPPGDNALRQQLFHTFISNFMELMNTPNSQMFQNAQLQFPSESNIIVAMIPLKQILEDCSSSSTIIKKMLLECMKPCIEQTIHLLPHYMHSEITFKLLLSFLHTTFMVLQHQLGSHFTANTIKNLLQLYSSEHLCTGSALDQFLEILLCIVSAPNVDKSFIPSIINLCLVNVWPAISSDLGGRQDTVLVMLRLFHSILIHRWKYFYATPILHNLCSDGQELVEHREELISILEIFGQALLQPDINIFRQSLECLEQVNTKWRLYRRELFKTHLLERYVLALMTVLIQKSQDLLTDEILTTLYNMAMVDTDLFYYKFLFNFIDSSEAFVWKNSLMHDYVTADQPTFMKKMMEMIVRLRQDPKYN